MNLGKLFGQNTGPGQTLAGVARQSGQGGNVWGNLAQSMVRNGMVGNRPNAATAPAPSPMPRGNVWSGLAMKMLQKGGFDPSVGRNSAAPAPFGPMSQDGLWNSFAGTMMRQNMDRRGVGPDGNPRPMPNGIGGVIGNSIQNPTQQPAQPVTAPMGGMMAPQSQMTLRGLGQAYAGRGQSGYGGQRF